MQIPFVGPAYRSRSLTMSAQRCVNLYLESDEGKGGKSRAMLVGTPGMRAWTTLPGEGGMRAVYPLANGFLLAVRGATVYRVTAAGTASEVGALRTNAGPVSIDENGITAAIADGLARYAVNLTDWSLSVLSGGAADRVAFIDGYFVFNVPQTGQFDVTNLYSTTIEADSYATAEGSPDQLVSLVSDHRELWLFGATSTEVWTSDGNADFPFSRLQGAYIQAGCAAPHSVARMDNSVFWLGADERGAGTVWRADGYRPMRVSTHAVERAIQSYPTVSDAIAYSYQQEGHTFYVLSFPSADRTWVFDAATGEWHERLWFDETNQERRHRGACACAYNNRVVVGDHSSGLLSYYDLETYTENGAPIRRVRSTQHIADPDYSLRTYAWLQVDMDAGYGLVTGQGVDPQAMLRWSDDGGRTWSNEVRVSIGRMGEYQARARWRRLGSARDRVFEVSVSDPVRVVMIGAAAEVN